MTNEVLTVIITSLFGLVTTIVATWQAIKLKRMDSEKKGIIEKETKSETHLKAINYIYDFEVFNQLIECINSIFLNTPVDRFLVLYAVNGKEAIGTVSVLFQMIDSKYQIDALKLYNEITVDNQYRKMLGFVENNEMILYNVDEMEESLLKSFYLKEGVRQSIVKFITRKNIEEGKDMIMFCSLATHKEEKISDTHVAFIKSQFGKIKKAIDKLST